MPSANGGKLLVGRGAVFFNRFTEAGAPTYERFLGQCRPFELNTTDNVLELRSELEAGQPLIARVNQLRLVDFTFSLYEFDPDNVALGLAGKRLADLTQTGATITDEPHADVTQGEYVKLAKQGVNVTAVKVGAAVKTLGVDYTVDRLGGGVTILVGGAIATLDDILVTYSYVTATIPQVAGGVSFPLEGKLRFTGNPVVGGPSWMVEVWKVTLSPAGAVGFIAQALERGTLPIRARVTPDTAGHPTHPYYLASDLSAVAAAIG